MYPVHNMNNFKSRKEVGDERFSKGKAGFAKPKSTEDKPSKRERFEHRKVESFGRNDCSPAVPAFRSSGLLHERSPVSESQQRNKSSWEGQAVTPRFKMEATREYSSSDESSKVPCRLHRKKLKKRKSVSKSWKLPSTQDKGTRSGFQSKWNISSKSSDSLSYDVGIGSLQKSSDSVNEYLANVSKELKQKRLLGKLDLNCVDREGGGYRRRATNEKLNALTTNFMYVAEELKQKRMMDFRNTAKKEDSEAAMADRNKLMNVDGMTFWSRMRNVFSMACWRGYTCQLTSDEEDAGSDEGSGSQDSKLTSDNSASTETTTVIPASHGHRRGQPHHGPDPAESRTSLRTCKNEKFMATKLVESVKRFFSMSPSTDDDSDQLLKSQKSSFEGIAEENGSSRLSEGSTDSSIECAVSDLQPSPRAFTAADPTIRTSDYEVVEINSKQRQPM